jgi:succinyl-CoA synthetase alpha subunit
MAILIDPTKRVIVQGITGREGIARTRLMKNYHTQVVGGVTPGKGSTEIEGVPVYDTVRAAWEASGTIDISVLFVPAPLVKDAALEALEAGVKLLVIVPDRVPMYDVMEIDSAAKTVGAHFIGPNTLGVLSPDKGVLGMMGGSAASARDWFFPGPVGVTSRSGGITTSIAYYLAKAGLGASTLVHVGGDSIVGMPHAEILKQFEADPQTEIVVLFGEIGTSQEEAAAAVIERGEFTKPLVAYVGGKAAKSGTRFSHATPERSLKAGVAHMRVKWRGCVKSAHMSSIPSLTFRASRLNSSKAIPSMPSPNLRRNQCLYQTMRITCIGQAPSLKLRPTKSGCAVTRLMS